jgi:hypothetical protein
MAKAESSEYVVLTLSKEEAQVLVDVISIASGMPLTTRRGLIDGIMAAMSNVNYHYNPAAYSCTGDLYACYVHFRETK